MSHSARRIGLCIPTFQAEQNLIETLDGYLLCKDFFYSILFIDSSSTDNTKSILSQSGFNVLSIRTSEFDHGGTRQRGADLLHDCDIIVFMTQDAILSSLDSLTRLIAPFDDPKIAISFGRQLPHINAKPIESHNRIFSYPNISIIKSIDSIPQLGIRTAVVSNSFAAYRRSTLLELGGFPSGTLFGEDTLVGARAILSGYKIAYVADSTVRHSHDYSLLQEFRRYFDNGAFYSREDWILKSFGSAEGTGMAYVISELKYLFKYSPLHIPKSLFSVISKYLGYKAGHYERLIPSFIKYRLSMNKNFWRRKHSNPANSIP